MEHVPYRVTQGEDEALLFRDAQMRNEYLEANPHIPRSAGRLCFISIFREAPQKNYIGVSEAGDDKSWKLNWDIEPEGLLQWMAGEARSKEELKRLTEMRREQGDFKEMHGWRPNVSVWDVPHPQEEEVYQEHLEAVAQAELADLDEGFPEDWGLAA